MPWVAQYRKATKMTGRKWYPAGAHRTATAEYDAQRAAIREKQMDALLDSAELAEISRNRKAFEYSMERLRDAREKHLAGVSVTEPKPKKPRKKRTPNAKTPAAKPPNSGADHVAGGSVLGDAGEVQEERAGDIPICGGRGTTDA